MILSEDYTDYLIRLSHHFQDLTDADQIIKVAEEAGEACEAYSRWKGTNPNKGKTGTPYGVAQELADVAATALLAITKLGFDPNQALQEQQEKTQGRFLV